MFVLPDRVIFVHPSECVENMSAKPGNIVLRYIFGATLSVLRPVGEVARSEIISVGGIETLMPVGGVQSRDEVDGH